MRRIGWAILVLAVVLAASAFYLHHIGQDDSAQLANLGIAILFLLGCVALTISAGFRLIKGEVKLRPRDAFKSALIVFTIMIALRALFWGIYPDGERDYASALLQSAAFSIAYGLYTTAYRRTT
ncbi:hypothetical protein GGR44_000393 [Sphingobium fontiphilum]|uniref:DUF2178 domain-containing protein n=1 Tax=Sphingobium fontiphilum TaxID=944425 RepID=A0A7W6GMR5_9SPHN|nr:hypothetical protein [Sphingobium fontiphilum]MBB3980762.1 hypothetical protein [Sphingobium fontiphilum]